MSIFTHKLLLILLLQFASNIQTASTHDIHTVLNDFWSISCEFSDVGRTRRSIPQEPNLNNPNELFDYLYPLADVKIDDFTEGEQRSAHSISTWIDDLLDLWKSECHSRIHRVKRATSDDGEEKDNTYPDEYENDYEEGTSFKSDLNNSTSQANTNTTINADATKSGDSKKDTKKISDEETFFTQYGGDIEYFFPLISFGIPFDGEITFLGFHGFKGLFPYR